MTFTIACHTDSTQVQETCYVEASRISSHGICGLNSIQEYFDCAAWLNPTAFTHCSPVNKSGATKKGLGLLGLLVVSLSLLGSASALPQGTPDSLIQTANFLLWVLTTYATGIAITFAT